jgi:hypothetical protein
MLSLQSVDHALAARTASQPTTSHLNLAPSAISAAKLLVSKR